MKTSLIFCLCYFRTQQFLLCGRWLALPPRLLPLIGHIDAADHVHSLNMHLIHLPPLQRAAEHLPEAFAKML